MIFDFLQQASGVQILNDLLAGRHSIQTPIGLGCLTVDGGLRRKNVDQGQVVASAHFVVVKVVGRGNLDAAGTKLPVYVVVGNNGNGSAHQGQSNVLAY